MLRPNPSDEAFCVRHSEWDLWGPLVICLALAIILSVDVSPPDRTAIILISYSLHEVSWGSIHPGLLHGHLFGHNRLSCGNGQRQAVGRKSFVFPIACTCSAYLDLHGVLTLNVLI